MSSPVSGPEDLLRELAPQVLGALLRRHQALDLCEDAVQEALLAALQAQCGFESGELRCIFVESQPLARSSLDYRIVDAHDGQRDHGSIDVRTLARLQPWGAP